MQLLRRLLGNVLAHPDEPKYRRVRLSNPKLSAVLAPSPAALRVLRLGGFTAVDDGEHVEIGDAAAHDASRLNLALEAVQKAEADLAAAPQ